MEYKVTGFSRSFPRNVEEKVPFERTFSRSNKSDEKYWRKRGWEFEQISTQIRIKTIDRCPNKFWYCCPKGMIPLNELPEYAGLYYIDKNMRMTVVKKAPFIHKEKEDLRQVLLDKFYWESIKLRNTLARKQLVINY